MRPGRNNPNAYERNNIPVLGCDPSCAECSGAGFRMKDEDTQVECTRMYVRKMGARLGPDLQSVRSVPDSPLFVPGDPAVDLTEKNCQIRGYWNDILGHLKWAFICKFNLVGLERFYFQVVTDQRLLNVWLSNEAYQAKARKKRDEESTFNSLPDLIGEMYSLVVIRLGFLGYPNRAMPGVLKEALLLRQASSLPTWIIEEPDNLFASDHLSWNPEVGDYVHRQKYTLIDLSGTETPGMHLDNDTGLRAVVETELVKPEPNLITRPIPTKREPPAPAKSSEFDSDPLLGGGTSSFKRSYSKRRGGD